MSQLSSLSCQDLAVVFSLSFLSSRCSFQECSSTQHPEWPFKNIQHISTFPYLGPCGFPLQQNQVQVPYVPDLSTSPTSLPTTP